MTILEQIGKAMKIAGHNTPVWVEIHDRHNGFQCRLVEADGVRVNQDGKIVIFMADNVIKRREK